MLSLDGQPHAFAVDWVIACGNTAIVEPSPLAPHYAEKMAEPFPQYLNPGTFCVIDGGKEEVIESLK